jgi:hypothetical protein
MPSNGRQTTWGERSPSRTVAVGAAHPARADDNLDGGDSRRGPSRNACVTESFVSVFEGRALALR